MNPIAPWALGTVLIVVAVVLFVAGTVGLAGTVVVVGIGSMLEAAGVLLWVRERQAAGRK